MIAPLVGKLKLRLEYSTQFTMGVKPMLPIAVPIIFLCIILGLAVYVWHISPPHSTLLLMVFVAGVTLCWGGYNGAYTTQYDEVVETADSSAVFDSMATYEVPLQELTLNTDTGKLGVTFTTHTGLTVTKTVDAPALSKEMVLSVRYKYLDKIVELPAPPIDKPFFLTYPAEAEKDRLDKQKAAYTWEPGVYDVELVLKH